MHILRTVTVPLASALIIGFCASLLLIQNPAHAARPAPSFPPAATNFGPRPLYSAGIKPGVIVDTFGPIDSALPTKRLQRITDTISEWQQEGIDYAAYYGMGNIESDPSSAVYIAMWAGALSLDLNGTERRPMCITHLIWRNYLIDSAKMAIDTGAKYILLDGAVLGLDSFDSEALAAFRTYLAATYTPTALTGMGVSDSSTFDYRQYLLGLGYTTSDSTGASILASPPNDALWQAWIDFHHQFERDFYSNWSSTLRTYAQSKGQQIYMGINRPSWGASNEQWNTLDLMDFSMAETFLDGLGYPYRNLSFDFKTSLALGKRFWSWNEPGNTTFPANPPSTNEMAKLFTAENFANGGLNQVPMGWVDFFHNGLRIDYLTPYYRLPRRHPELFNGVSENGEIGVLYTQDGATLDTAIGQSYRAGTAMLEASHRPYDTIFAGSSHALTLAELTPYTTVLLPNIHDLSDAEVTILESYLAAGGMLIGTGMIGDKDKTGAATSRAITTLFQTSGVQHPASGGTVISFPASNDNDITIQHYTAADGTPSGKSSMSTLLSQFETVVDAELPRDVTTDLPSSVHLTRFLDSSDGSQIYHLLNYDYNMSADTITSVSTAQVSLPVPAGFTAGTLQVSYFTPSAPDAQVITASVSAGKATFTLPSLGIWGILKLGSAAAATATVDDPPQSDLIDTTLAGSNRPDAVDINGNILFPWEYWKGIVNAGATSVTPFSIPFTATDDHGLTRVDLYSRYSVYGSSWGTWALTDSQVQTGMSYTGSFTQAPSPDGYYQYHVVAVDDAAQTESVLPRNEISYGVDATPPPNPSGVSETHGIQTGVGQSTVTAPTFSWTAPVDALSGTSEYALELSNPAGQTIFSSYNQDVNTTTWSPGTLVDYGTYELHVQTKDLAANAATKQVVFQFVLQAPGSGNSAPTSTSASINTQEDTTGAGVTPSVTDPDSGDTHTFSIETQPSHGSASIVSNQLVYNPSANFNGSDSFTFRATDSGSASVVGTASVNVSPVNDPPTATSASISTTPDTPSAPVIPNVTDPDVATNGDHHTFQIVSSPNHGQAQVVGNALVYTPFAGYSGLDSFTFRATDQQSASIVGTANVSVGSGPPPASEFNLDFGLHDGPPTTAYGAAANVPGVWNEVGLGTSASLLNLAGTPTGVGITVTADSDTGFGGPAPSSETDYLLGDFVYKSNGAAWQIDISGLPAGDYWLWLYSPISLPTGALLVDGTPVTGLPGNPAGGTLIDGVSYTTIPVTVGAGNLVILGGDPSGSGVAGLQILSVPEPSSSGLSIAAIATLLALAYAMRREGRSKRDPALT